MFNVKGPDLLWLDKPADPEPEWEAAYEAAKCQGRCDAEDWMLTLHWAWNRNLSRTSGSSRRSSRARRLVDIATLDVQLERRVGSFAGALNTHRNDPRQRQ